MGLVNGDMLNGALISAATSESPVGSYTILLGTLHASANYRVTFNPALLTIDPARTIPTELRAGTQQMQGEESRANMTINNPLPSRDANKALPDADEDEDEDEDEE